MPGSVAARRGGPRPSALEGLALPCLILPALTVLLALGVPFLTIGRWLAAGGTRVLDLNEILPALWQTLLLALAGGLLTMAAALPVAWLAVRDQGPLPRLLESCGYVVGSLPSVVVALAVVSVTARVLFRSIGRCSPSSLPTPSCSCRAIIGLRASLAQVPVELEQAAASLGKSPARALWATTVRLSAPGAAAGMTLASLGILNELTATQMLGTERHAHLGRMGFGSYSSELDYAAAAPYALITIVISLPLTWLLFLQSRRLADR